MITPGASPVVLSFSSQGITTIGLSSGQTLQGVVRGGAEQQFILIGSTRIPLQGQGNWEEGQRVRVEVLRTGRELQLRVSALAEGATSTASTAPASEIAPVLREILGAFGALQSADAAARIVPQFLPASQGALQALLALFLHRGGLGRDFHQLEAMLTQAAAGGILEADSFSALSAIIGQVAVSETTDFKEFLRRFGSAQRVEARIAGLMKQGLEEGGLADLLTQLRQEVARLRGNEALRAYLRGMKQLREFEAASQRSLERLTGSELQNVRGMERPYVFFELPFPPDGPIERACCHFFSEGGKPGQGFDKKNAGVALDLSTARLGDLWITLRITRGRCQCVFKAALGDAVKALSGASDELTSALERAGYPGAVVRVDPWDGDRLGETAALMRDLEGLNLEA